MLHNILTTEQTFFFIFLIELYPLNNIKYNFNKTLKTIQTYPNNMTAFSMRNSSLLVQLP
jgi:hypothetical protein